MAILALLGGGHSTEPPYLAIPFIAFALIMAYVRTRSRGGRGPGGGGGPFGGRGGPFGRGNGPYGGGRGTAGGGGSRDAASSSGRGDGTDIRPPPAEPTEGDRSDPSDL